MKTKVLPFVVGFLLLIHAAMGAGTVSTALTPIGTVSACYKPLDVTLTFNAFDCGNVTLQGNPGTVISFGSGSGFTQGDVTFNSPDSVTVNSPSGTAKTGTISLKVALTGCNLYTLPPDSAGLRHVQLTTSYLCPTPQTSLLDVAVNVPTLQIVPNPFGSVILPSHDGESFLMNQVVDRYYAVVVPNGIVDYFTFKIQPEPGIEVQAVHAVDANAMDLLPLFVGSTTAAIDLEFGGPNGISISQCNASGVPFLDASITDYIILRERIKITACSVTGEPETVYTAAIHCDEDINSNPCWTTTKHLDVHCEQRTGARTGLNLFVSDQSSFNSVPLISQAGHGPDLSHFPPSAQFGPLSICGSGIDYHIFIENYADPDLTVPPLPPGAGTRRLDLIYIPINGDYFTYDDIKLGNTTLVAGTHYTRSGNGTPGDVAIIDLATLTADPDGPGGLTDVIGSLGVQNSFKLLKEGEYLTIVLENLHFFGQNNFTACDQSAHPYNLTPNGTYLTVTEQDMCHINDLPKPLAQGHPFDFIWRMRNSFSGFAFAQSDTTDIAPATAGKPHSANLSYKFTPTSPHPQADPFSISQRPDYGGGTIWNLMGCPDLNYYAALTLPLGFSIPGNQVTVTDPDAANSGFIPTILPVTGTYPDMVVNYTGIGGQSLSDGHGHFLSHPAQVELTFNVTIACGQVAPATFGSAFFPLQFRASCDNGCPGVYRVLACATLEVFFHCFGPCNSTVSTTDFTFRRRTPGWPTELDYALNNLPLAAVPTGLDSRSYECDIIRAESPLGRVEHLRKSAANLPGTLAFEIAYDPPVDGANIFKPESGVFNFTPRNGTPGPSFFANMQSWDFRQVLSGRDTIRVYADMNKSIAVGTGIPTVSQLLASGDYDVDFLGDYKVVDGTGLAPGFFNLLQVRAQLIDVEDTLTHDLIETACDSWGQDHTFFKTKEVLERNGFIPPSYNVQFDWLFPENQCVLRYVVIANTSGGLPSGKDFLDPLTGQHEFRPQYSFPDRIELDVPSDYLFDNAYYAEGTPGFGAWTPYNNVTVGVVGSILTISGIHANNPGSRSIEKVNGSARQGVMIKFTRKCPLNDPPIIVNDLDITNRAYAQDIVLCQQSLMPTQPQQISYNAGPEVHDITMTTVPQSLGNLNPITVPIFLNHNGDGTGVDGAWIYLTPVSGNIISITPSSTVGSLSSDGLYHLGTLPNTPVKVDVTVVYDCSKLVGGQRVFDPTPIKIKATYGNSCFGYPTLVPGYTGDTNTDFVPIFTPCLAKQATFEILPQPADLSLNVGTIVGSCGDVSFDLQAKSNGSDVAGVVLLAAPPSGYVLNMACSTIEGQSLTAILNAHPSLTPNGNLWDVSGILLQVFGQSHFFFDALNTQFNPLDFHLCYSPVNCTVTPGPQFEFSMSGTSACGVPVAQSVIPVPIGYIPPAAPTATVIATLNPVTTCANPLRLTIDLAGITYVGNLKATVTATFNPAFGFVASSLAPQNITAGAIDWVINSVSSGNLTITADLSVPLDYCQSFPVTVVVALEDVTACCTKTAQYMANNSQYICCLECVSPPRGLVNWWTFDELTTDPFIAKDSAGSDDHGVTKPASASAPTRVPGIVDNAICFSGDLQWMEVSDSAEVRVRGDCNPNADGESITIDAWIKPSQTAVPAMLIDKRQVASQNGYSISIESGGFLRVALNDSSPHSWTGTYAVLANQWNFIAVTLDRCGANTLTLFVNSTVESFAVPLLGKLSIGGKFYVGRQFPPLITRPPMFYAGCIDELEFFKRALDRTEVDSIRNAGSAGKCKDAQEPCHFPVAHYTMDGSVTDVAGNHQPTVIPPSTYGAGQIGQGVVLPPPSTATSAIEILPNGLPSLANPKFTFEAWVRPDGIGVNDDSIGSFIMGKVRDGGFAYATYWRKDGRVSFLTGALNDQIISVNKFPTNCYHHVVGTYDGSKFQLYVNGNLEATRTSSALLDYSGSYNWTIGGSPSAFWPNFARNWVGVIDDVKIWCRALSAAEVQSEYLDANPDPFCPCPQDPWVNVTATYPGPKLVHVVGPNTPCCGSDFVYHINYGNNGSAPVSGAMIQFSYPTICSIVSITPSGCAPPIASLFTPNTLGACGAPYIPSSGLETFSLPTLNPGDNCQIAVKVHLCCGITNTCQDQPLLLAQATILPSVELPWNDCNPTNNVSSHTRRPCCSFDPNDCTVTPKGCGPEGLIHNDQSLTYLVQFQNEGSAYADVVVVQDVVDADLDLSTFEALGSSHNYRLQRNGRGLVFVFENIALPPQNIDVEGSHGFVKFRIRPRPDAPVGTVITNSASIYFDANDAIDTVTTTNTITEAPVPKAAFIAVARPGSDAKVYDFTSTGGTLNASHRWYFGPDATPNTSTGPNPTGVIFQTPGSHLVSLETSLGDCVAEPAVQRITAGRPQLSIVRTTSGVGLSWAGSGYRLQEATDLTAPIPWNPVEGTSSEVGGWYFVQVPPPIGTRFYRLVSAP